MMATAMWGSQGFGCRILDGDGHPVGSGFHVGQGYLVTADHVLAGLGVGDPPAAVSVLHETGEGRADVVKRDPLHDLAVLKTGSPPARQASVFARTEEQGPGLKFQISGYASVYDGGEAKSFDHLSAVGEFWGFDRLEGGVRMAGGNATGVEQGLSGAPVLRIPDGVVIGVQTSRYTSDDEWSQGRIWFSLVEDLLPLIEDLVNVPVELASPVPRKESQWLAGTELARSAIASNEWFVLPVEWAKPWEQAAKAVSAGDVVVIPAPPAVGATTFAERLLAEHAPPSCRLIRLDPDDWQKPAAACLPLQASHAYVLDLRDPEIDRPQRAFVQDLGQIAPNYRGLQSRLVITVADALWSRGLAEQVPNLQVIRLDKEPDPVDLVTHYLQRTLPAHADLAKDSAVRPHLEGRNAIQAMEAVETIRTIAEEAVASGELDELRSRLGEALDDHHDALDQLFGSRMRAGTQRGQGNPLPPEDRCLLIALALKGGGTLAQVDRDGQSLAALLKQRADPEESSFGHLSGPGLRNRVLGVNTIIGPNETVRFNRTSFGAAAVYYAWDNYAPIRPKMIEWLLGNADEELATDWVSRLVRRHQDVDFIRKQLVELTRETRGVLVGTVKRAVQDPHMRRRCERFLYDWAVRPDLQMVVVEACRDLLTGERRHIAIRRLQRVANEDRTEPEVHRAVLEILSTTMKELDSHSWLWPMVQAWIEGEPAAYATMLAFMAILQSDVDGIPWLVTDQAAGPGTDRMLAELMGSATTWPLAASAVRDLLEKVALDDNWYNSVLDRMAAVAVRERTIAPILSAQELTMTASLSGRRPIDDLAARIGPAWRHGPASTDVPET